MATLKDVAKKSGVAVGTASAVINNKSWVSEKIRRRVLKAIEELNYQPNQLARNFRTQKTNTIGIIVPDITNPFFPQVIRSIGAIAHQNGYSIILCDSNEDYQLGIEAFHVLLDKKVDGIILIGGVVPKKELVKHLTKKHPLIVVIERDYGIPEIATVVVDAIKGGYLATKHLLDLGYNKIGIITGPLEDDDFYQGSFGRYEGYKKALQDYNISFNPSMVKQADFSLKGGYQATKEFLKNDSQIQAIFAFNDLMAIGAMEAIKEKGLQIPEDIAVVGYDDIPEASYVFPALTTIRLPKAQLGKTAVEILLNYFKEKQQFSLKKVLPTELVIRQSCGASLKLNNGTK
jgi:LacI family transcriptional regulator